VNRLRKEETKQTLLSLHKHKTLAVHTTSEHIAFSWSEKEGCVCTYDCHCLANFFSEYNGKLIFKNAVREAYQLIVNCFDGKFKAREYFSRIEDVSFLCKLGNVKSEYVPLDMPLEPLSEVLDGSLELWHMISKNLPAAQESSQIDIYANVYQPALSELLKMKLANDTIEIDTKAQALLDQESEDLVSYLHKHPKVVRYNAFLASHGSEKFCAVFDPINKRQVRELLKGIGYPEYFSVFELLWTGDDENVISAICGVIRRSEYSPIVVPEGYKIKCYLNPIDPIDRESLIDSAYSNGYMEGCCGIRFYTPLAKSSIRNSVHEASGTKEELEETIGMVRESKCLSDYEVLIKMKDKIPFHIGDNEILFLEEV